MSPVSIKRVTVPEKFRLELHPIRIRSIHINAFALRMTSRHDRSILDMHRELQYVGFNKNIRALYARDQ